MSARDTPPLILVVEDEGAIRELLGLYLREEGFAVLTASDGLAALALLSHHRPAAMIVDLMLPRMDGLALLQELERVGLDQIPVIAVSASRQWGAQLNRSKIVGFLAKPFDLEMLDRLLARALAL